MRNGERLIVFENIGSAQTELGFDVGASAARALDAQPLVWAKSQPKVHEYRMLVHDVPEQPRFRCTNQDRIAELAGPIDIRGQRSSEFSQSETMLVNGFITF